jgi:arylsulfatase A-like enzyme
MLGLVNFGFSMDHYQRHILHVFKGSGYKTAACGIQHIVKDPNVLGYDEILHRPDYPMEFGLASVVTPQVVDYLSRGHAEPFFLVVGFKETHRPYDAPTAEDDPRYIMPPTSISDAPETRLDMASFHASARKLDNAVGEILSALERNGQLENTLVIYSTDHGLAMPQMKCNLYDAGSGVGLIMRGPREFVGGKVFDALITQLDLFPTLCDYIGVEHPAWLQGKSMMPIVHGEQAEINDEVHAEVNYHISYEPMRMVRTHRYKYIRHYLDRDHPVIANCDSGSTKDFWLSHDWQKQISSREELYDTVLDPNERHNLIDQALHHEVAEEMRGRLDRWMLVTEDPILKGPIQAPPGAQVWAPDGAFPGPHFVETL